MDLNNQVICSNKENGQSVIRIDPRMANQKNQKSVFEECFALTLPEKLPEEERKFSVEAIRLPESNFEVVPKAVIQEVVNEAEDGSFVSTRERGRWLLVQLTVYYDKSNSSLIFLSKEISIPYQFLQNVFNYIKGLEPCIYCEMKNEKNMTKLLDIKIAKVIPMLPLIPYFKQMGWQRYNRRWIYSYDNRSENVNVIMKTGHSISFVELPNHIDYWSSFLNICNIFTPGCHSAGPIILFSFFGVLTEPFRQAGYMPKMLLYIYGESGSRKTSIARELFRTFNGNISCDDANEIRLFSSECGIEAYMNEVKDCCILVDDVTQQKTKAKADQMNNNLEHIIRCYGDGTKKYKSDPSGRLIQSMSPDEMVAITGEFVELQKSSMLRCIFAKLQQGDVNDDILAVVQNSNPHIVENILKGFITFIENKFELIVSYIESQISELRQLYHMYFKDRMLDQAVHYVLVADILTVFFISYCNAPQEDVHVVMERLKDQALQSICKLKNERNPYMEAVSYIVKNILCISECKESYKASVNDGFYDSGQIYVWRDKLQELVSMQIGAEYSSQKLYRSLVEVGVIETFPNGDNLLNFKNINIGTEKVPFVIIRQKELFEQKW